MIAMGRRARIERKQDAGPGSTLTSLAEIIARLQDQLLDDAKVVEAVARLSEQGRLRRLTRLDRAA